MPRITVTVRHGPRFSRSRCESLEDAVELAVSEAARLAVAAPHTHDSGLFRKFAPVEQVAGRVEIKLGGSPFGGATRGGIDVRGDGSMEAYTGRVRRDVLEPAPGESLAATLSRSLGGEAAAN